SATRARSTLVSSVGPRGSSSIGSVLMLIIDVLHVRVEFGTIEPDDAISSERLGDVERSIRRLHQLLLRMDARVGPPRHAHAERAREDAIVEFELVRLYLLTHALGERHRGVEH